MGSSGFPLQPEPTLELMMFNFLLLVTLATLATAIPVEVENTETKASSPLINCGCQCSSLTFRDANGVVQGNCLTVDSTGAQWCYVDQAYSSCQDLVPSKRFPTTPGHTRPVPLRHLALLSVPDCCSSSGPCGPCGSSSCPSGACPCPPCPPHLPS